MGGSTVYPSIYKQANTVGKAWECMKLGLSTLPISFEMYQKCIIPYARSCYYSIKMLRDRNRC